jgi:ABC-type molybdate transport system ATPase subunit
MACSGTFLHFFYSIFYDHHHPMTFLDLCEISVKGLSVKLNKQGVIRLNMQVCDISLYKNKKKQIKILECLVAANNGE